MPDRYDRYDEDLPPELAIEARRLRGRDIAANALLEQAFVQPRGMMAGRFFVAPSPLQGVSQITNALASGLVRQNTDRELAALGKRYTGEVDAEKLRIARIAAGGQPRPQALDPQEAEQMADLGTAVPQPIPAAPDRRRAVLEALGSQYKPVQRMGAGMQAEDLARIKYEGETPSNIREWDMYNRLSKEDQARYREMKRNVPFLNLGDVLQRQPGVAEGPNVLPKGLPPQETPEHKGRVQKATTQAKEQATREFNMAGIGQIIDESRAVLEGESGVKPTGSGFGSLRDMVTAWVGIAPEGAAEADQLEALSAALTTKMPRMEGPQSDADRKLYIQAAGDIGDRKKPRSRRLASLATVEKLWRKYEPGGGTVAPPAVPQQPNVIEFDATGKRITR